MFRGCVEEFPKINLTVKMSCEPKRTTENHANLDDYLVQMLRFTDQKTEAQRRKMTVLSNLHIDGTRTLEIKSNRQALTNFNSST